MRPLDKILAASAGLLMLGLSLPMVQAQDRQRPLEGGRVDAVRGPDQAEIPPPGGLSTGMDSRLFVESFMVAMDRHPADLTYRVYFHPELQEHYSLEDFAAMMKDYHEQVGELQLMGIQYLKEHPTFYGDDEGGYADYLVQYQRDPQVKVKVGFRRVPGGPWKVTSFAMESPAMQRLDRARDAAQRQADEPEAPGSGAAAPPAAPPRP